MRKIVLTASLWISSAFLLSAQRIDLSAVFKDAETQAKLLLKNTDSLSLNTTVSPRTWENGVLRMVPSRDWTSGFFPGELWYIYAYSGKKEWLDLARRFTEPIEKEQYNTTTHDMGFKVYCSVGNGYKLTNDPVYRNVLIQSAKSLATRFNKTTGVIRSWDHSREKWANPVIIDNMMNLELLFEATKLSGDSSFYNIAVSHANMTMKNHFRADYSSYHVLDYDTVTGKVVQKTTHQGYSNSSAWARGQAWALYGYTMCYRETKNMEYLKQAEQVAKYILNQPNMPNDLVPYWDYNVPNINQEPRDASAAAVTASGLLELSTYSTEKKRFFKAAKKMLVSLTDRYRALIGTAKGFILLHSTGAKPSNSEVDVPLIYADYYYLEALLRLQKIEKEGKQVSF